jgi:hypothetical protein
VLKRLASGVLIADGTDFKTVPALSDPQPF